MTPSCPAELSFGKQMAEVLTVLMWVLSMSLAYHLIRESFRLNARVGMVESIEDGDAHVVFADIDKAASFPPIRLRN